MDIVQDRGLEQLLELAAVARAHFQEAGLLLEADRPFVPHVTVAKTSKLQGGRGGGGGRWARGRGAGGGRHGHGGGEHAREQGWREQRRAERRGTEEGLEGGPVGQADLLMDGASGSLEEQEAEAAVAAAGAAKSTQGAGQADVEALPGSAGGLLPSKPAAAADDSSAAGDAPETSGDGHASTAAAGNWAGAQLLAGDPGDAGTSAAQQKQQEQQAQQAQQQHEPAPQGWRQIPAEAWAPLAAIVGGTAVLAEVQLCAMQGRKPGEYYPVLCSLPLLPRPDLASSGAGSGDGSPDRSAGDMAGGLGGGGGPPDAAEQAQGTGS